MNKFVFFLVGVALLYLTSCTPSKVELENGIWRGVFRTDSAIEIPFNFEIYDSLGVKQLAFINANERLNINEVTLEGDSVFIKTPLYETEIRAEITSGGLKGTWTRHLPNRRQRMPFEATSATQWRFFQEPKVANRDISGRWSVVFRKDNSGDTTVAIGEFVQEGNQIAGTFLTNTGDYRFLSGEVDGDMIFLSSYAGASPSLFVATVSEEGMEGDMYAGPGNHSEWRASRDENAMLSDAYNITRLKEGLNSLDFKFPDMDGNLVSLTDDRFKNKVVVLQFLGSWCPNCMDETAFLSPFYKEYKEKGLEVIGLAYERYAEPERAKKAVENLISRFDVTYPILLTGFTNNSEEVLRSMPALESFRAFPTTILIDKEGVVRSIHTGFSGPATGDRYTNYVTDFERTVNELLSERN